MSTPLTAVAVMSLPSHCESWALVKTAHAYSLWFLSKAIIIDNVINGIELSFPARSLGLKQNVCCFDRSVSGFLSAIVVFMTRQTALKSPKSGVAGNMHCTSTALYCTSKDGSGYRCRETPHSEHRFPAPSSKLCQIWLRH